MARLLDIARSGKYLVHPLLTLDGESPNLENTNIHIRRAVPVEITNVYQWAKTEWLKLTPKHSTLSL